MILANRPDGFAIADQCDPSPGRGFADTAGRSSLLLVFRVKGK